MSGPRSGADELNPRWPAGRATSRPGRRGRARATSHLTRRGACGWRRAAVAALYQIPGIDRSAAWPKNSGVLARVLSAALVDIEAVLVRVEVDVTSGCGWGFAFPSDRITVNLAPADIRKEGASFDLPIALAILAATRALKGPSPSPWPSAPCRCSAQPPSATPSRFRTVKGSPRAAPPPATAPTPWVVTRRGFRQRPMSGLCQAHARDRRCREATTSCCSARQGAASPTTEAPGRLMAEALEEIHEPPPGPGGFDRVRERSAASNTIRAASSCSTACPGGDRQDLDVASQRRSDPLTAAARPRRPSRASASVHGSLAYFGSRSSSTPTSSAS